MRKQYIGVLLLALIGYLIPIKTVAKEPEKPKLVFAITHGPEYKPAPKKVEPVAEVPKPQPKPRVQARRDTTRFQCVVYARLKTGIQTIRGKAKNVPAPAVVPTIGGAVKTTEGRYGHIAVIIGIEGNDLILSEANYVKTNYVYGGPVTEGRRLPMNSPRIVGYIN